MNQFDLRLLEARIEIQELKEQLGLLQGNYECLYRYAQKLKNGRIKVINIYN